MGIFDKLKITRADKAAEKELAKVEDAKKEKEEAKKKPAAKKQASSKSAEKNQSAAPSRFAHHILLAPIMTEKSLRLQQENKYTFRIATGANKIQVKQSIKEVYGIPAKEVRIVKEKSKNVNRWGRKIGATKAKKKAIVTMPEGTVINLTE